MNILIVVTIVMIMFKASNEIVSLIALIGLGLWGLLRIMSEKEY